MERGVGRMRKQGRKVEGDGWGRDMRMRRWKGTRKVPEEENENRWC